MARRIRHSASQRRRRVAAYRASSLSQIQFSKDQGISTTTLGRWLREFPEPPAFVEVVSAGGDVELVLEFGAGLRLRLPRGFDAGEVRRLVHALC
jgi:hypothetical protein